MSKTGTVKSWKKVFGFAEAEDKTLVYIHQSEIEGGKLRVGRTVKFDTEKVEGHEDRVKGVNVSGEAVLKKGEKLSDEDFAADKKIMADLRDARKAENEKAFEPIAADIEKLSKGAKLLLVRTLAKELKIDDVLTKGGKNEKRPDVTTNSKKGYTKAEFLKFYGKQKGEKMWALGKVKPSKKKNKKAPKKAAPTEE